MCWSCASKYKRKRISYLWWTLSHEQYKTTESGEDWSLRELCIACIAKCCPIVTTIMLIKRKSCYNI